MLGMHHKCFGNGHNDLMVEILKVYICIFVLKYFIGHSIERSKNID